MTRTLLTGTMYPLHIFRSDNAKMFCDQARQIGAELQYYPMYRHKDNAHLETHVATIGKKTAPNVIVVSSGIHGVDLPVGSALQRMWLCSAQEACASGQIRFVFAHDLNPFGTAYGLRTDEKNIDPNRNFIWDYKNLPQTSENYHALADALSPAGLGRWDLTKAWGTMLFYAARKGVGAFERALVGGQYDYPDGLYYGGDLGGLEESRTRRIWERIVLEHVITPDVQNIWHIDTYTGNGPCGKLSVMASTDMGSSLHKKLLNIVADPKDILLTEPAFAKLSGDIVDYWPMFKYIINTPDQWNVFPLAVGVGTTHNLLEQLKLLNAMVTRNTLWTEHKDKHKDANRIIDRLATAFLPKDEEVAAIQKQGHIMWHKLIEHINHG